MGCRDSPRAGYEYLGNGAYPSGAASAIAVPLGVVAAPTVLGTPPARPGNRRAAGCVP